MRFPVFSSDHFTPQPQFHGCGPSSGRGGCCSSNTSTKCPFSSLPEGAAAASTFIPVMMMGPRYGGTPRPRRTAQPSAEMPRFCAREAMSQPVITEAFNMAQGLLGELLGQYSRPPAGAERRSQTSEQSSSATSQGNCPDKTSAAPASKPSNTTQASRNSVPGSKQKPSHDEKSTASMSTQKPKDQRTAEKSDSRRRGETTSGDSKEWSHSLPLAGFAPTKVSVKVKNGKVHIHAVNEKCYGPGACPCKLETTLVVNLPENIDQKTLRCSMKNNSTLVLQAVFKDSPDVEKKTEEGKMLADQTENAGVSDKVVLTHSTDNKPQSKEAEMNSEVKTLVPADHGEEVVSSEPAEEQKMITENLEALEAQAERKDAPESEHETMFTSETEAEDLQSSQDTTEHNKTEENGDPLQRPETDALCYTDERNDELIAAELDRMDHHIGDETQETVTEQLETKHTALQTEADEVEDAENQTATDKNQDISEVEDAENQTATDKDQDISEVEDAENQTATDKNRDISFPIIEEPDDEPTSRADDLLQNHRTTHDSSTEDFVIIEEDSISSVKINSGTGNNDGINDEDIQGLMMKDKEQTEEGEETAKEISSSGITVTDPTRPIKRVNSQENTQDSKANFTTPEEQSEMVSSESYPLASHSGGFQASLPLVGFSPEDVHVNLQGHNLRIVAKRQAWLGEVSYMESVDRRLELPGHVDVLTVRCVYEQDNGCLVIRADPLSRQRQVPVVLQ